MNKNEQKTMLLANRLTPTDDQIRDWLQSSEIKRWVTKLMIKIPNSLKMEAVNTIIKNVIEYPNKDCRVEFGSSAIGVDVLRWKVWAAYRSPYDNTIKAPDCPYTLRKHLEGK